MTDSEIIKALECCKDLKCSECPKKTNLFETDCDVKLCDEVIALINRQKSKIEALQMDYNQQQSDIINANQNLDHITELWEAEKEKVEKAKQKVINICKELQAAKAEIESLNIQLIAMRNAADSFKKECGEKETEIERLTATLDIYAKEFDSKFEDVRAEAIKEFAERFEEALGEDLINYYPHILTVIDNLVKEMTEE